MKLREKSQKSQKIDRDSSKNKKKSNKRQKTVPATKNKEGLAPLDDHSGTYDIENGEKSHLLSPKNDQIQKVKVYAKASQAKNPKENEYFWIER